MAARQGAAPAAFLAEAAAAADDHPLFSRLAIPHPAETWPRAREDYDIEVLDGNGSPLEGPSAMELQGDLFLDGSCALLGCSWGSVGGLG